MALLHAILFALVGFVGGCGSGGGNGDPIHLIVPVGHQGVLRVICDGSDSGGYAHLNGENQYTFGPNGTIHVKSDNPIHEWHREIVTDASGKSMPGETDAAAYKPPPGTRFICRDLGSGRVNGGPQTTMWVVGTPDYCKQVQNWWESGGELNGPPPKPVAEQGR